MDSSDVWQLIALIILLALSAFFSSSETALTTVNRIRMRNLEEEGVKNATIVNRLLEDPKKMLSAILIGNNIVNISASALATLLATSIGRKLNMGIPEATFVGAATGILTVLVLIFGEITPKSLATLYSEKLALKVGRIIYWLTILLTPVIFIINAMSRGLMKLMGVDVDAKGASITENEFLTIVDVSHEEGVIESEEREMINNVVDFGDALAKDVMVPRIDIAFVSCQDTYEMLVERFREEKYSRMPVYEESKDNVIGTINLKDLFYYDKDTSQFDIHHILREPYFTYEFQKTSDLMIEMRKKSINIAIVLDEYGATAGLITLEDLLEEIVGEIRDEYDGEELDDIQAVNDREYLVQGTTKLDDINSMLHTVLESDDYDSIAGHLINVLGHIPTEGEGIEEDGIRFVIEQMDKNRIESIRVYMPETNDKEPQEK